MKAFPSLRNIYLNLFYENKQYAKSVACHQSKLVKDEHNVILILVSSSKFNSLFRRFSKILVFSCSSFLSGVPSFLGYIISKLHLIIARLHLVLSTSLSFYHPFYYRSSSWRLYMVVRQGFLSFFNCSSRFLLKL